MSGAGEGLVPGEFPAAAVDRVMDGFRPPLASFELRHLGGAFTSGHGGAVSSSEAEIAVFVAAAVPTPELREPARRQLAITLAGLSPWVVDRSYLNVAEAPRPLDELFPKNVVDRSVAVRAAYDPSNLILANHTVDPA